MKYNSPVLFKKGPSALIKLIFFVSLSITILIIDIKFNYFETIRILIKTSLYPIERILIFPYSFIMNVYNVLIKDSQLIIDNYELRTKNLYLARQVNLFKFLIIENKNLRALMNFSNKIIMRSFPAEIENDIRNLFSRKIIIGCGSKQGIRDGSPVVNENGLIGQVTRVYLFQSEVTLITDKDQAVPVQSLRTGLRGIIYGMPKQDMLNLCFIPINADVKVGDEFVTSGLDKIYPSGLPVAKVISIDKKSDFTFINVKCLPISNIYNASQILVLNLSS